MYRRLRPSYPERVESMLRLFIFSPEPHHAVNDLLKVGGTVWIKQHHVDERRADVESFIAKANMTPDEELSFQVKNRLFLLFRVDRGWWAPELGERRADYRSDIEDGLREVPKRLAAQRAVKPRKQRRRNGV